MAIDLYYMPMSAPCRSVIMVAKELNIPINLKVLDLMKGEHLAPEFVAINPQHCIPTIVDTETGFALWESRAILTYLVNKFAPGHSMYPTDPQARAEVDRLLFFDIGTLYKGIGEVLYPVVRPRIAKLMKKDCSEPILPLKDITLDEDKLKELNDKLAVLDTIIAGKTWVTGDNMTVADLALHASLGQFDVLGRDDLKNHANITAWRARVSELPYDKEVNVDPLLLFKSMLDAV